jgi:hypothetical protein
MQFTKCFSAALAAALLAAAPAAIAQTSEMLLPDPSYPEGGDPERGDGGGRSLLFPTGDGDRVYVGTVNYNKAKPTVIRIAPDAV